MAGIIGDLQNIYGWIVYLKDTYDTIEGNKGRCRHLIDRCRNFEHSLRTLEKTGSDSPNIINGVRRLAKTIKACVNFIEKYGKKGWKRLCLNVSFAKSIESEFMGLNAELTQASADLQFGLSVQTFDSTQASNTDDEHILNIVYEAVESNSNKVTTEIQALAVDQSTILAKLAVFERLFPELLSRSSALLDLVHHQALEENQSGKGSPATSHGSTATVTTPTASTKSPFDDLKFSNVDMSALQWNRNDPTAVLGKGSFATVYRCLYEGHPYAIKHFENVQALSSKEIHSIKREARIMQVTKHANIISFVGFNVDQGVIISELAVGSLHDVIHKELTFPNLPGYDVHNSKEKIRWLTEIALALRYLHFHHIIHRDIKPQNILMVCENVSSGRVVAKVADFGISTAVGMTTMGTQAAAKNAGAGAAGSTSYMAPELIDFDDVPIYTPAVDVFSFGIMANEVMIEEIPWLGFKVRQIENSIGKGKRPRAFTPSNNMENELFRLIGDGDSGCLAGDLNARPDSSRVAKELQRIHGPFLFSGTVANSLKPPAASAVPAPAVAAPSTGKFSFSNLSVSPPPPAQKSPPPPPAVVAPPPAPAPSVAPKPTPSVTPAPAVKTPEAPLRNTSGSHIMISCCSSNKSFAAKIGAELKARGYDTWREDEGSQLVPRMNGYDEDIMAEAVEKSKHVVICVSRAYKDSPICKMEANYASQLAGNDRLKLHFVMLEENYTPLSAGSSVSGWLGLMIGDDPWYTAHNDACIRDAAGKIVVKFGSAGRLTR